MSKLSIYELVPLPLGENSLRALVLLPGKESDSLCGKLELWDGSTAYEALSWCWGKKSPTSTSKIALQDDRSLEIQPNLEAALCRLRLPDKSRRLWIDAICINQGNNAEKNDQVPQMARVYEQAKAVLVWLGEPRFPKGDAIEFLKAMSTNLGHLDDFLGNEKHKLAWEALLDMMDSPWFERKWIVQEVAFASACTIYYGSSTVDWKTLRNITQICKRRVDKMMLVRGNGFALRSLQNSCALRLITLVESIIRIEGRSKSIRYDLETVVPLLAQLKVTVPHDNFYAALALSRNSQSFAQRSPKQFSRVSRDPGTSRGASTKPTTASANMVVDYNQSFLQVCRDFLEYSIKKTGTLDILCHPWVPASLASDLPSWILTIPSDPVHEQYHFVGTYYSPNGHLVPPIYPYSASGSYYTPSPIFSTPEPTTISLSGFILAPLDRLASRRDHYQRLTADWLTLARYPESEAIFPERLRRTLVANRWDTHDEVQDYYGQAFEQMMLEWPVENGVRRAQQPLVFSHSGTFVMELNRRIGLVRQGRRLFAAHNSSFVAQLKNTIGLVRHAQQSWTLGHDSSFVTQLEKRIVLVCQGRRLFVALVVEEEVLGLAPEECEEGDVICILCGCSVPVALRKVEQDGRECYRFLGACYVHGMMQGEAMDLFETRAEDDETGGQFAQRIFEVV